MMLRGWKEMLVLEVMEKKRRKKKRDLNIETKIAIDNCFFIKCRISRMLSMTGKKRKTKTRRLKLKEEERGKEKTTQV